MDNIDPGTCQVTFPNLDKDAWDGAEFVGAAPVLRDLHGNSPGVTKVMTPPQLHISVEMLSRAGWLPEQDGRCARDPGRGVAGMHGIGVSTPRAAAVADATVGLAMEKHARTA